ncbi:hypothetical protein MHM84_03615 [Halomonas sp. McH1-25]|uniref:hypothetical protein n=1 Tax=unclassified Halomonas TaxID=2609666 RepID=UPI001EF3E041|nr:MULTISPECIES: hypothetical protein [unclassified Halomonas]MCG7598860.1 hypothetical protein [Halomonas sp. McH1-25]MCP1340823.1 hypothetical protein [Halomonas sp. FL8]MCP1361294.1 hypothetical protein [Halomonas sp. BBD45]MCP1364325.1 hypothetical protein [Halomonas sp. BBD48]
MTTTSNPKLAWALATDSSVRCAPGPWDDIVSGGRCIMTSLEHKAEYARIYGAIQQLERDSQELAAIGHVLCNADTEQCNQWLDMASGAVFRRVASAIPNWDDNKAWRLAKKERVEHLVKVALMERSEDLSGERASWGPEKIKAIMESWFGISIVVLQWQRDWMPVWSLIQVVIDRLESEAMQPIEDEIVKAKRLRELDREAA